MLHPAVILFFDGFAGGRHTPSAALAARFPDDVQEQPPAVGTVDVPSFIKLHSADEDELVDFLRCDDSTVVHFAMAALEGKWLGECGSGPQEHVERAMEAIEDGDLDAARALLEEVVDEFPGYSYAWCKLGNLEYREGGHSVSDCNRTKYARLTRLLWSR